ICNFSFALVHSTTKALPAWRTACKDKKMAVRLLPRDVRTRWNSTYNMLVVAVQYKEVLNALTADRNLLLRRYELSDNDWAIIDDLVYTLEKATLLFSSDKSTIANVITTMDKVDDLITTTIVSTQPSGRTKRVALGLAKATMNKYYSATDKSNVYRIAMGMC
ncbi:hypothetical protein B0H14DRAFT_2313592, partial [Mycena olivaceomarginata]